MSRWVKLIAERESINDSSYSATDGQVVQLFESEVRQATEELKRQRDRLEKIIKQQNNREKQYSDAAKEIEQFESYAIKALEKEDEELAKEIAEKIYHLESQQKEHQKRIRDCQLDAGKMRTEIRKIERDLKRTRQQLDTAQAAENVQRAQLALVEKGERSMSKLYSAIDAAKTMKLDRESEKDYLRGKLENTENEEDTLIQKLKNAGIIQDQEIENDIETILSRLKRKNSR